MIARPLGCTVTGETGTLWLTNDHEPANVILDAGQSHRCTKRVEARDPCPERRPPLGELNGTGSGRWNRGRGSEGIARTMPPPAMQRHPIKARTPTPSLPDRLDRLAQLSLHWGTLKSEPALLAAVVDEAARLLGAQRVLLVLQTAQAAPRIAGSKLPTGESADNLLQAVTPWLDDAVGSGASRLRHGPAGVEPIEQRSCLVAPLMTPQGPLGCLYADLEGPQGRFESAERALLSTLAAQAAMTLENARLFNETREAQEQQKASSDVLEVISQSMGDSAPVFEAILERCERLIEGSIGSAIELVAEDGRLHRRHFRGADAARRLYGSPAEVETTSWPPIPTPSAWAKAKSPTSATPKWIGPICRRCATWRDSAAFAAC